MARSHKRYLALAFVSMMAASLLAGCSLGTPSAEKIVSKSLEAQADGFEASGDIDITISVSGDAVEGAELTEIPISVSLTTEVASGKSHGEATIAAMDQTSKVEYYNDGRYQYLSQDKGPWQRSETGSGETGGSNDLIDPSLFADEEVVYDGEGKIYTITTKLGTLLGNKELRAAIQELIDTSGAIEEVVSTDDILDVFEDGKIELVFDAKTCQLRRCTIDDLDMAFPMGDSGVVLNAAVGLAFEFSRYDKIETDDVEVPASVERDAVDADDDPFALGDITEDPGDVGDRPVPPAPAVLGDDVLGSLNGVAIVDGCGSWADYFGADGWTFDETAGGPYPFVVATNPRYPGADLYVYSRAHVTDYMLDSTPADIEADGFYGYSIDLYYSEAEPGMTWNGLTFGASAAEILAVYGQPSSTYFCEMYDSYTFDVGGTAELEFFVYGDRGLREVSCTVR